MMEQLADLSFLAVDVSALAAHLSFPAADLFSYASDLFSHAAILLSLAADLSFLAVNLSFARGCSNGISLKEKTTMMTMIVPRSAELPASDAAACYQACAGRDHRGL